MPKNFDPSYFDSFFDHIGKVLGITFSRDERHAPPLRTVGDLQSLVISKFPPQKEGRSVAPWVFYRLRTAIISSMHVERMFIKPSSQLESLIPSRHRRAYWHSLQHAVGWDLKPLEYPGYILYPLRSLIIVTYLLALVGFMIVLRRPIWNWIVLGTITAGMLALCSWAERSFPSSPLALKIPSAHATVRQTVLYLLINNYGDIASRAGRWNRQELLAIVVKLTAEWWGCSGWREVTPETKFDDICD
jgi:hypothetical protein